MQEILIDSVLDCLKLLPFLYLSYLAVEYAEHRMSEKTKSMIYRIVCGGNAFARHAFSGVSLYLRRDASDYDLGGDCRTGGY